MIIRHRTRNMIIAAAAGAAIFGIPLVILLVRQNQQSSQLKSSLTYYEQLQKQYQYTSIYELKETVAAGEVITKAMIQERNVQSVEELDSVTAVSLEELAGKRAKISLSKGALLQQELLYSGEEITTDQRILELSFAVLPEKLKPQDWIDVRISYPDGEDYVVVKHKQVYELLQDENELVNTVQIRICEEELLRLSAAYVDMKKYQDTTIYAIQYTGDFQDAAKEDYPVNTEVFTLIQWDPNIQERILVDQERQRRKILEGNLEHYLQKEPSETTAESEDSEEISQEQLSKELKEELSLYTELPEE